MDPNTYPPGTTDPTLHSPRILCLHGGGTNARIFRAQCRSLSRALGPYFRLVFAEAPYASEPGPDVLSVYAADGPFKRWLRWLKDDEVVDDKTAVRDVDKSLKEAMEADDKLGADGDWAAVLGFSQGAKLAVSLLFRQQQRATRRKMAKKEGKTPTKIGEDGFGEDGIYDNWKFAVVLAGRAPIVNLEPGVFSSPLLSEVWEIGPGRKRPDLEDLLGGNHILRLPSIHVHGLDDEGLHLHQMLLDHYTVPDCTKLVQWDGGHRVVLKSVDVQPVVDAIVETAKETGVL